MKQTQTHMWSLAAYSLARAVSCRATPGQREITETVAKQKQLPQPAQPRYHARGARPEDHVINIYTAPSALHYIKYN